MVFTGVVDPPEPEEGNGCQEGVGRASPPEGARVAGEQQRRQEGHRKSAAVPAPAL